MNSRKEPKARKRFVFFAQTPPPLSGQTVFNAALLAVLARSFDVKQWNTGSSMGEKLICAVRNFWLALFFVRRDDIVYVSWPGHRGGALTVPTIVALGQRRLRVYIHHHSYRVVAGVGSHLLRMLIGKWGEYQSHILLSRRMSARFLELYQPAPRVRIFDNALLFLKPRALSKAKGTIVLGHMSVITREKGAPYLLDLFRAAQARGAKIRMIFAGPVHDPDLLAQISSAERDFPAFFSYWGPVHGHDKARFFKEITHFLLPSSLPDEADPLVILEAYSWGCDVFGTAVGSVRDRLSGEDRVLTLDIDDDLGKILSVNAEPSLTETIAKMTAGFVTAARSDSGELLEEWGLAGSDFCEDNLV